MFLISNMVLAYCKAPALMCRQTVGYCAVAACRSYHPPPPPSGPVRPCQPSHMQAGSRSYRIVPSGGLGLLSALSVGCVLVYLLVTLTYPPPCSTRTCDVMYCVANNIDAANVQHACLPLLYLQVELRNAAMRLVSCTKFVKQVQHTCEFVYNPT